MTPAERKALDALHVWLHHPHGDYDLIEACAEFHEERTPVECELAEFEVDKDLGAVSAARVAPLTILDSRRGGS
jgi:hypothetical protein